MFVVDNAHAPEHARFYEPLFVTYLDRYLEGSRLWVDHRADARHLGDDPLALQGVDIDRYRLAGADLPVLAFGNVQVGDQGIKARNLECRITDAHRGADLDVALGHHAVNRCTDLRIVQLEAGEVEGGLESVQVIAQFFEVALGEQVPFAQLLVALEIAPHLVEACAGLIELQTKAVAIEASQDLALLYVVALFKEYFPDFAFDLCDDLGLGKCFDWRGTGIDGKNVAPFRIAGFDGYRRRFFLVARCVSGRALLACGEQQCTGERRRANAM